MMAAVEFAAEVRERHHGAVRALMMGSRKAGCWCVQGVRRSQCRRL